MSLRGVYEAGTFALSFELFPPKTSEGVKALFGHVEQLNQFDP